jgi:mRNA interferase MazF
VKTTCMAKAQQPQRGEVWMVQFDPSVGAEIRKVRPALVVSLNTVGRLPLRIVVPLTDWQSAFTQLPWFVYLPASPSNGLTKDSGADAFQVKSVSDSRFVRYLGMVTSTQLDDLANAVALCAGAP